MQNNRGCLDVIIKMIFGFIVGFLTVYALILAGIAVMVLTFLGIVINALIN